MGVSMTTQNMSKEEESTENQNMSKEEQFVEDQNMSKEEQFTENQNMSKEGKSNGAKGELLKKEMPIRVTDLEQGRLNQRDPEDLGEESEIQQK